RHAARLGDSLAGELHRPDVRRPRRVEVAGTVEAVDRAVDHAHVALALLVLSGLRLPVLLREVLVARRAREGDRLAVGRPRRGAGPLRQVGERARLAAAERDQPELAGLGFAVLLDRAVEGELRPVGRPARVRVLAARERARRLAAVRGREPDRAVVALLLLVDAHAHEGHLLAVGRDLGIRHPD